MEGEAAATEGAESVEAMEAVEPAKAAPQFSLAFPAATLKDFADDVPEVERQYCIERYADLNAVKDDKVHCTACNRHIGLTPHLSGRLCMHPLLRTLVCRQCLQFYSSGDFDKGEDGSELYCRWCGQGGQVYCCSICPTVFCCNCIKRNFDKSKIDEIENIDEWNCFICKPEALWKHRSVFWAARRYCFLKSKMALTVADVANRDQIQKECQLDESRCCKAKARPRPKPWDDKERKKSVSVKRTFKVPKAESPSAPPTPELPPPTPVTVAPKPTTISAPVIPKSPIVVKKTRKIAPMLPHNNMYNPLPFRAPKIINHSFPMIPNDNLNLSLENLTQGLQMMSPCNNEDDGNVICTPDFPMLVEPECELNENIDCNMSNLLRPDDEVECLTPVPKLVPKPLSALTEPVKSNRLISVVKMSENDVTINKSTGNLKFRINPSTLSSNKMYQLPDGRVFSVTHNPSLPGGYSATIVNSVKEFVPPALSFFNPNLTAGNKSIITDRNDISDMNSSRFPSWTIPVTTQTQKQIPKPRTIEAPTSRPFTPLRTTNPTFSGVGSGNGNGGGGGGGSSSDRDLIVLPKEWYVYNLYECHDLMTHITKRLDRLKDACKNNSRNITIAEMVNKRYVLDQLLKISIQRFTDLKSNLNREFKKWAKEQTAIELSDDDESGPTNEKSIPAPTTTTKRQKPNRIVHETIFIDENSDNDSEPKVNGTFTKHKAGPKRMRKRRKLNSNNTSNVNSPESVSVIDNHDPLLGPDEPQSPLRKKSRTISDEVMEKSDDRENESNMNEIVNSKDNDNSVSDEGPYVSHVNIDKILGNNDEEGSMEGVEKEASLADDMEKVSGNDEEIPRGIDEETPLGNDEETPLGNDVELPSVNDDQDKSSSMDVIEKDDVDVPSVDDLCKSVDDIEKDDVDMPSADDPNKLVDDIEKDDVDMPSGDDPNKSVDDIEKDEIDMTCVDDPDKSVDSIEKWSSLEDSEKLNRAEDGLAKGASGVVDPVEDLIANRDGDLESENEFNMEFPSVTCDDNATANNPIEQSIDKQEENLLQPIDAV